MVSSGVTENGPDMQSDFFITIGKPVFNGMSTF